MTRFPARSCRPRVEAVTQYLEGEGVAYDLVEHESVTSAVAEAHVAGVPADQVAKTVLLHDGGV